MKKKVLSIIIEALISDPNKTEHKSIFESLKNDFKREFESTSILIKENEAILDEEELTLSK